MNPGFRMLEANGPNGTRAHDSSQQFMGFALTSRKEVDEAHQKKPANQNERLE